MWTFIDIAKEGKEVMTRHANIAWTLQFARRGGMGQELMHM